MDMRDWNKDWTTCHCCGGDVPPESLWGADGEADDGYCPGWCRRDDGTCGAFAERDAYDGDE